MAETFTPSFTTTRDMGVYLHIPFCRKKCSYCDFASYEGLEAYYDDYVEALCAEIKLWAELHPESTEIPVNTIYFGGGTPTQLSLKQLEQILKTLYTYYPCDSVQELSIEANPGEIEIDYLKGLKSLGVTRISYGVQTFDDELLKLLRRGHNSHMAKQAITDALSVGFNSVSGDLIYALPGQTLQDIKTNVATMLNLGVSHISIYGLQLEEGTNLYKQVELGQLDLPSDDANEAMYDCMLDELKAHGFERYEISNFTNNGSYSYHNLRYWQYKEYLAFGAGAYSFYEDVRRNNEPYVVPYINRLRQNALPLVFEEPISEDRAVEDFCFLALRTKWGLSAAAFKARFHSAVTDLFGEELKTLIAQGLLQSNEDGWRLTREGAKHGNYVFSQFIR
ncbi:MAG: radical SAM family heme chaperone HemW [Veillonella sp.]|uniref:radical SAM family heme chaperone HemW n=1 Tax=Veillonella sp. TaxID=1926307 RepID=UPI0025FCA351|nr:radical SAM family heme chaperone HemW [Veillonella sp.]MBE6079626.1 radical SAM family heme chaperone HemW [Veillonella sp.]